jgi:hypothetical protein
MGQKKEGAKLEVRQAKLAQSRGFTKRGRCESVVLVCPLVLQDSGVQKVTTLCHLLSPFISF